VFPIGKPAGEGGPPFGCTTSDLVHVLPRGFDLTADEPVAGRTRDLPWSERWAGFRAPR
jgi:hypothetical protein